MNQLKIDCETLVKYYGTCREVANILIISRGHFCGVKNGTQKGSKELIDRIEDLAIAVRIASKKTLWQKIKQIFKEITNV